MVIYLKNLIRFFDLILGALTDAPKRLAPVIKIPLNFMNYFYVFKGDF